MPAPSRTATDRRLPASSTLHSLFVHASYHGQGIGRELVERFEMACLQQDVNKITVASSLYAVPFYQRLGYKKSTGVRYGPCFDGADFPTQPMQKTLPLSNDPRPGAI